MLASNCKTYSKTSLTLIFCVISLFAQGQREIKKYVVGNTVQINSIEPYNENYKDLEAIGDAIGDAKIVMLGEQDHGDAPGHLAKTRLIKYLHEKKGFNVVAHEDDFVSINSNWASVKAGRLSIDSFVKRNVSLTWTSCEKVSSSYFLKYVLANLKSNNPIEISGFDIHINTPQTLHLLDSVVRSLKIPLAQSPEYLSEIVPLLNSWYNYTNDSTTTDRIIRYYKEIKVQMLEKLPVTDFWIATVDVLIAGNMEFKNWKKDYWKDRNIRDKQMAANLKWLTEIKYPKEKIIVWAHNYHVSKYSGHYPKKFLNEARTMGSFFTDDSVLMRKTYIIGFTSYQGTAGRLFEKKYKVQKPKRESFENWIDKGYNYAFVDFKKFNIQYPLNNDVFFMKCSVTHPHHRNEEANWTKIFDGIFYIKNTYPCG